ncbi:galactan 5-O-arabinofuranosyltransferase [Corynebacterium sp. 335C]
MSTADAKPAPHPTPLTEPHGEIFADDQLSTRAAIVSVAAAAAGGALAMLVAWFVLKRTSLPAFGGSNVSRAVASAVIVALLAAVVAAMAWWANRGPGNRPRWAEALATVLAYLSPAGLVAGALAVPLSSTRLYLDGISVDQEFRTEYLTRMASEFGLHDMSYIDVPPFYPAGWFFLGGRLANVLGMPGWEVFQPWGLMTLAAAGCALVPVWRRLCGSLVVAAAIGLTTTAVALSTTAEEPYAAAVAMGLPALAVMARRALAGAWSAMAGVIVFLGVSATWYTLHTAVGAAIVAVLAVVVAAVARTWLPLLRLAVMGAGSGLIALTTWGPYLWARVTGAAASGATATHYLPENGARLPLPMLSFSVIGVVCLAGVAWLVVRALDPDARALGIGVLTMYGWAVASMAATLLGGTLLGFRLDAPVAIMLATAGVLAIADVRLTGVERLWPQFAPADVARRVSAVAAAFVLVAGVAYAQAIPSRLHGPIDLAHTDTDGYGERADRFAPDAGVHYAEIDRVLREKGLEPSESVVLTDERNFQAYWPWYSFQALTSHYANPLGEFDRRNAAIAEWAALRDPAAFDAAIDASPWRGPDAMILRGDLSDPEQPLMLDLADDIYPNDPNVLFRGIAFDPAVFAEGWEGVQVGPFAVLVRR